MSNELEIMPDVPRLMFSQLLPGDMFRVKPEGDFVLMACEYNGEVSSAVNLRDGRINKMNPRAAVYPVSNAGIRKHT